MDDSVSSTAKEDVINFYKVQTEMSSGYFWYCVNIVRTQNPNATLSDVVRLIGNIYPFSTHEHGSPIQPNPIPTTKAWQ